MPRSRGKRLLLPIWKRLMKGNVYAVVYLSMNDTLKTMERAHTDILHQVFDQSTEGFQVIDRGWRYVYVNETVAKQGKNSVADLTGHTMMEKYPGIEKTPLFTQLKRVMDEKVGIRMENEFIFPGGDKGWFQLFIHPWSGGIMIFSIDITGRKLGEERILQMIEHCRSVASSETDKTNIEAIKKEVENLGKPSVTVIS